MGPQAQALADHAKRRHELGEDFVDAPLQDTEFVLYQGDNIQVIGFLGPIKPPHCVEFQSKREVLCKLRGTTRAGYVQEAAE